MRRSLSLILAALLVAGGWSQQQASGATKLNLLYTAAANNLGGYVAKDQGFFEQHGLDVDVVATPNGSLISAALVADSAQIGTLTPSVLLQADEQGLDLVAVAGSSVYPTNSPSGIMARSDSGIKTARDLVGRKVGVPGLGGALDVLARDWVNSNGADYHKVDWIEVPFPQMNDGLKSGLADAVVAAEPFVSRIIATKAGYKIGEAEGPPGTMILVYTATRAWTQKNPGLLQSFRAALEEAVAYARDPAHADPVRASIAKFTKLPPQAMASIVIPNTLEAHASPQSLAFWIKVSREQGLIKGNPDPARLVAP